MSRKVPPNPKAPPLPRRMAKRVADADEKSAMGYDAIEDATALVAEVAKDIRSERITLELYPEDMEDVEGEKS